MKQASRINRIKFPIVPTSKRFIFPIGFNGITSLLHYRLLIRFLFLNEKHVRQSGRRLPLLSLGLLLSTEQYVTPPHSQRGARWKCENLCNSKLNIRCWFSRRAISTSVGRVHLLRLQPHYKGLTTLVASHKVTMNSKLNCSPRVIWNDNKMCSVLLRSQHSQCWNRGREAGIHLIALSKEN